MNEDERVVSCQNEIRRLRNIVRFYDENGDSYLERYKKKLFEVYAASGEEKNTAALILKEMEYILETVWEYDIAGIRNRYKEEYEGSKEIMKDDDD